MEFGTEASKSIYSIHSHSNAYISEADYGPGRGSGGKIKKEWETILGYKKSYV